MKIPFSAIKSFVDPFVEFGLSFDGKIDTLVEPLNERKTNEKDNEDNVKRSGSAARTEKKSGDVVSLENFRKS